MRGSNEPASPVAIAWPISADREAKLGRSILLNPSCPPTFLKGVEHAKKQAYSTRIDSAAKPLRRKLEAIRDSLVEVHSHSDQITLHYPIRLYNMLLSLAGCRGVADGG